MFISIVRHFYNSYCLIYFPYRMISYLYGYIRVPCTLLYLMNVDFFFCPFSDIIQIQGIILELVFQLQLPKIKNLIAIS